jgi:hypothetical protein
VSLGCLRLVYGFRSLEAVRKHLYLTLVNSLAAQSVAVWVVRLALLLDLGHMHTRNLFLINGTVLTLQLFSGVASMFASENCLLFTFLSFGSAFVTVITCWLYLCIEKNDNLKFSKTAYILLFFLSIIIPTCLIGLSFAVVETDLSWISFIAYYVSLWLYFYSFMWRHFLVAKRKAVA